jgi:gluconokinase
LLGLSHAGQLLTPVFTWADSRASSDAAALRKQFSESAIHARTGCMLRPSFWPAKLRWLRRTQPQTFRAAKRWISPVDWIFEELFAGGACSGSMASATGLFNLQTRRWDEELCEACGISPNQLSPIRSETDSIRLGSADTRVFTAIGDGAAGNIGSGADRSGLAAVNVGTSAAVRMVLSQKTGKRVGLGLFRYLLDERMLVGGAVSNAGNLRQWSLRELRTSDRKNDQRQIFSRARAAKDSLVVLPFWSGERAPTWPENQFGVIDGFTQTTTSNDLARALTCSVFYRLAQILALVETSVSPAKRVIVSGGILRSRLALPLLADALGHDLEVTREPEASLRGAAVHALRQMNISPPGLRPGRTVKHDKDLALKHRDRREQQVRLEARLVRRTSGR